MAQDMVEGEKILLKIEMPVSEAQDMVDGEKELREIEMPRKILPSMEILTTIIQIPENDCIPRGKKCSPKGTPCCSPYHCIKRPSGGYVCG
jgi:hypothetical protein